MNSEKPDTLEFSFPPHSFTNQEQKLVFHPDSVSYAGKTISGAISSIRYGIKPLQFDMFGVGLLFLVDLRDENNGEINIRFRSFFSLRKNFYYDLLNEMADAIWDRYAESIINHKLELLYSGKPCFLGQTELVSEGIMIAKKFIPWMDCLLQKNYDRLIINHRKEPSLYAILPYAETWDAFILQRIIEKIQGKG